MMAAMRLNIPALFVSGGPMEAGVLKGKKYDLIDAITMAADASVPDKDIAELEKIASRDAAPAQECLPQIP
jgi:dihydroxy-acid dehydratase